MKPEKENEAGWKELFERKWDEIGMPDMERFTFQRINKLMEEIENPEERLLELGKIKNGIETAIISTHSWKGIALKRVESAIQLTRDETKYYHQSKPNFKLLKREAIKYYDSNKETLKREFIDGRAIAREVLKYLESNFQKPIEGKYPSPDTIRKNWLELTG